MHTKKIEIEKPRFKLQTTTPNLDLFLCTVYQAWVYIRARETA